MARYDWDYVPLPKEMVIELDKYLTSEDAKRYGIRSRAELLRFIVREFIDKQMQLRITQSNRKRRTDSD